MSVLHRQCWSYHSLSLQGVRLNKFLTSPNTLSTAVTSRRRVRREETAVCAVTGKVVKDILLTTHVINAQMSQPCVLMSASRNTTLKNHHYIILRVLVAKHNYCYYRNWITDTCTCWVHFLHHHPYLVLHNCTCYCYFYKNTLYAFGIMFTWIIL